MSNVNLVNLANLVKGLKTFPRLNNLLRTPSHHRVLRAYCAAYNDAGSRNFPNPSPSTTSSGAVPTFNAFETLSLTVVETDSPEVPMTYPEPNCQEEISPFPEQFQKTHPVLVCPAPSLHCPRLPASQPSSRTHESTRHAMASE